MARSTLTLWLLLGTLALPSCATPEAHGLDGRALYREPIAAETRSDRETRLAKAREVLAKDPHDVDALIWLGRRTAYLGRYNEAIAIYAHALAHGSTYPKGQPTLSDVDEARVLRHRGHRYVTIRRLGLAIADFERAARLVEDEDDRVEADGLPNARGQPTSTLKFNIWYHLGLAHYAKGDFATAARAYAACLAHCKNPDALSAATHWAWMTHKRLGEDAKAAALLQAIDANADIIENRSYHDLCLLYRGDKDFAELAARLGKGTMNSSLSALAYGLANWLLETKPSDEGLAMLERIVAGGGWAAFGYLAAEADLARQPKRR